MSTRASILVTDSFGDKIWFYRHSDGYPSIALKPLITFLKSVVKGELRDNASQSAGWLIVLGHREYAFESLSRDWKVGSMEPATGKHGDIDYLYKIDLKKKIITVFDNAGQELGIVTINKHMCWEEIIGDKLKEERGE